MLSFGYSFTEAMLFIAAKQFVLNLFWRSLFLVLCHLFQKFKFKNGEFRSSFVPDVYWRSLPEHGQLVLDFLRCLNSVDANRVLLPTEKKHLVDRRFVLVIDNIESHFRSKTCTRSARVAVCGPSRNAAGPTRSDTSPKVGTVPLEKLSNSKFCGGSKMNITTSLAP